MQLHQLIVITVTCIATEARGLKTRFVQARLASVPLGSKGTLICNIKLKSKISNTAKINTSSLNITTAKNEAYLKKYECTYN